MKASVQTSQQDGRYIAVMDDWWMASGKTKRTAIEAVIKRYQRETDGLWLSSSNTEKEPTQQALW